MSPALVLVATLLVATPADGTPRRWALVIGENAGIAGEERLRFAEDDARRMLDVLREVGGVAGEHAQALYGADAGAVREALARFGERLTAEASPDDWLVVYVSSHAGDGALHLRGTELPLAELLEFVRRAPVGVGLLVVDSCRSGSLTRLKGLKPAQVAPTLQAANVEGRVVISSSGADEYAQESEALGGSFFTHHLVAGLRGAADATRDGRITLEEAYGYAYTRTLESTLGSPGGLQRPSFRTELRGHGELVVAEPARARSRLTLGVDTPARFLIVAASSGAVLAELEKGDGPAELAVPAGTYRVRLKGRAGWLERTVVVPAEGGATLRGDDLERVARSNLVYKGLRPPSHRLSAGAVLASGLVQGVPATLGFQASWRKDGRLLGPLDVLTVTAAARQGTGVNFVPFLHREVELGVGVGRAFELGPLELAATAGPGALLVFQSALPHDASRFGLEPFVEAAGELRWRFLPGFAVWTRLAAGVAAVRTDSGLYAVPRGTAAAGFGADW